MPDSGCIDIREEQVPDTGIGCPPDHLVAVPVEFIKVKVDVGVGERDHMVIRSGGQEEIGNRASR
jgi:hypothetical protein